MKKRVFFKWIFCLLGGVMFFACSKDYKGLVEVDNSIENIQIKNGMLVFPNHEVLENVINEKESLSVDYVNGFRSQQQMFEEVVAAESKQMNYLDSLSGEALRVAPKHTALYEDALKNGLIKKVFYNDGTSIYDYNLAVPYYAPVLNTEGFFAVRDTLYQVTKDYVKIWMGADIYKKETLSNCVVSDKGKNILVFDYRNDKDYDSQNLLSRSGEMFPAAPANMEQGILHPLYTGIGPDVFCNVRFTFLYIDKIGLALPKYSRNMYLHFTAQKRVNGTSEFAYMNDCSYSILLSLKTQKDDIVSDTYSIKASGMRSNVWLTVYMPFKALIEGQSPLVTDEPYTCVLYAQPFFYVEYNNNQSVASAGFTMTRNSILSSFDYNIAGGTYTRWLTEADLTGL